MRNPLPSLRQWFGDTLKVRADKLRTAGEKLSKPVPVSISWLGTPKNWLGRQLEQYAAGLASWADKVRKTPYLQPDHWDELFREEINKVRTSRQQRLDERHAADDSFIKKSLVGLALSGGGIRSAVFSLGVMQALAAKDLLRYADYLSTVSGGGYIGGSLTWFLSTGSGASFSVKKNDFPFGTEKHHEPDPKREPLLRHLRQHGSYLAPGCGITVYSLIAVIARGIFLNAIVWLPAFTAVMVAILWTAHNLGDVVPQPDWIQTEGVVGGDALAYPYAERRGALYKMPPDDLTTAQPAPYVRATDTARWGLLIAPLFLAGLFGVLSVLYSMLTAVSMRRWRKWFSPLDVFPSIKGFLDSTALVLRYSGRRAFEKLNGRLLQVALLFAILASLPWAHEWLAGSLAGVGLGSLLTGTAGGVWSFLRSAASKRDDQQAKIPLTIVVPLAAGLFLYGLALVVYWAALQGAVGDSKLFEWRYYFLGLSVATMVVVNLNLISVHRYYRDRLMETFMPDVEKAGETGPALGADRAQLHETMSTSAPYPLINCNAVLVDSENRRFRHRGGDSFILSPLYCGGESTGWISTAGFMQNELTLPTAVAISGAAANPNTGVGGSGPTRNKVLSLLMALLNLRLGYWMPNPDPYRQSPFPFARRPDHFLAFLYEAVIKGYREESAFMQISDGGHFENLGVYELIRRKARVIICCDGGEDPETTFADLRLLLRLINEDFGAQILFEGGDRELGGIIPTKDETFPPGVKFAKRGHAFGQIVYQDGSRGDFILLKSTPVIKLDINLKGYKGEHKSYPDESTADQFFDEEQFEAYRVLGYELAERMTCDKRLKLTDGSRGALGDLLPQVARQPVRSLPGNP